MKRRIGAWILSGSLLFSSLLTSSLVFAETLPINPSNENEESDGTKLFHEGEIATTIASVNSVLEDLLKQAKEEYIDSDEISIIVEVNDKTMKEIYGMSIPDIAQVRTQEGLEAQLDYAKKSQAKLMDRMDDEGIFYEITSYYDTVLNGFALKTTLADAKKIAVLEEVSSVEVSKVIPAPVVKEVEIAGKKDRYSNEMIKALKANSKNYSGKGQFIAIIDSGGDPDHDIFKKVDQSSLRIKDEGEMNELMADKKLERGKYFNPKIPYGYNYAERNTDIKERTDASHGMHVAGIIAANSEELTGVAPDAQLAIMRVFGGGLFGGGTTPEIYNKAIDDAVKLGVDSINMSLGATSATDSRMEKTTIKALQDAQKAGIVVAIAAGNDGFMGFGILDGPPATQPDYGLINSPSVAELSLSVASVDNIQVKQRGIIVGEGPEDILLFMETDKKLFPKGEVEIVDAGYGTKEEVEVANVSGKVALVQRGDKDKSGIMTFFDKVKNPQDAGAVAVIVYNNVDEKELTHMRWDDVEAIKIPSCFVSKESGELLKTVDKIRFSDKDTFIANPSGYQLSNFSSWGMTQEGNMKPDISAPGGKIYSSINNNTYEVMSGTSMATPHVSGGIAVVKQYVEKTFSSVQGMEKHQLVKNLLMSTASPYKDTDTDAYSSPRGQGAGLMNLDRATSSNVVVLGTNDISSINLRKIEGKTVTIRGKLKNYGDVPETFEYYAQLNTDTVENGRVLLKPKKLESSPKKSITVEANGEEAFEVTFDLSDETLESLMKEMPKGFFLEGYVLFDSQENDLKDINVPFVGFKGEKDWKDLQVIEDSIYDFQGKDTRPYYYDVIKKSEKDGKSMIPHPFTHLSSKVVNEAVALGEIPDSTFEKPNYQKDKIAFSPNSDGKADYVSFVGTFLRNYKDFEISIYKKEDSQRQIPIYKVAYKDDYGLKNFFVGGFGGPNLTTEKPHWKWKGQNNSDESVLDGDYMMVVKVKPDGESGKVQEMVFPVKVDTVFPRIVKSSYNEQERTYHLEQVEETGSGIRSRVIVFGEETYTPDENGIFKLPENVNIEHARLRISDYAYNILDLPLSKAVRTGEEKSILVNAMISSGSVPIDKYKWKVLDKDNNVVDPYNLESNKEYVLELFDVSEEYEIENTRIPFTIGEQEHVKVISVKFKYRNRKEVNVTVSNPRRADMRIFLIDKVTAQEYELTAALGNENGYRYSAYVPVGEYRLTMRDLSEEYYATVTHSEIKVEEKGIGSIYPHFEIVKKRMKNVTFTLERNGYEGGLEAVFRARDIAKTIYSVEFAEGETQKMIKLPDMMEFDVYIKGLEGSGYGSPEKQYKPHYKNYKLTVSLIRGQAIIEIPVDKEDLALLLKKARELNEKDFYEDNWEEFEVVLEEAEAVFADSKVDQDAVNSVLEKLKNVMDLLIPRKGGVSKAALMAKIKEAEDIYESLGNDYTPDSKEFLALAIQGAKLTLRSKDPKHNTQEHIDATIQMLQRAIDNLKRIDNQADKNGLKLLLDEAKMLLDEAALYKAEGIEDLKIYYEQSFEIYENKEASAEEVKKAIERLKDSLALIESKAEKKDLIDKFQEFEKNINLKDYVLEGRKAFREAMKSAQDVIADKRAKQSEVDQALANLIEKRNNLRLKGSDLIEEQYFAISITTTSGIQITTTPEGKAKPGDKVQIFVVVEDPEHYELNELKVMKYVDNGQPEAEIELTENQFIMPNNDIMIQASLKEKEKPQPEPQPLPQPEPLPSPGDSGGSSGGSSGSSSGGSSGGSTGGGGSFGGGGSSGGSVTLSKETAKSLEEKAEILVKSNKITESSSKKIEKIEKEKQIYKPETLKALEAALALYKQDEKKASKALETVLETARVEKVTDSLEKGYMNGYEGNQFKPENKITRAEAAKMFADLIDEEVQKNISFADVKQDAWYTEAVNKLSSLSYLRARDNGEMKPNESITRAEYAYILAKLRNLPLSNKILKDVDKSHWAYDAIAACVEAGIIAGYDDGSVRPDNAITRAEAVAMISRTFDLRSDITGKSAYSDVAQEHWAYKEIVAARKK